MSIPVVASSGGTSSTRAPTQYGREYAIKLLPKANLDEKDLFVRLAELARLLCHVVFVPFPSPNRRPSTSPLLLIRTLPRCIARWKFRPSSYSNTLPAKIYSTFLSRLTIIMMSTLPQNPALTHTPPTLGLHSSLHRLDYSRAPISASMFAQMYVAVATRRTSLFHRGIKPENFIVTGGWSFSGQCLQVRSRQIIRVWPVHSWCQERDTNASYEEGPRVVFHP